VEQQNANPQLTPAAAVATTRMPRVVSNRRRYQLRRHRKDLHRATPAVGSATQGDQTAGPPDPMAPIPAGGYFVQVAAVSKPDDAEALVDALKKKAVSRHSWRALPTTDKLFPRADWPFRRYQEAEASAPG